MLIKIAQGLFAVFFVSVLSNAQQSSPTRTQSQTQATSPADTQKYQPTAPPSTNANKRELQPAGSRNSVGGRVTPPKAIYTPAPEYPKGVKRKKNEGKVIVWVLIDEHGNPSDLKIARTGGTAFDEKALEAVQKWHFKPSTKDGQPIATQANIEIDFSKLLPMQWQ